MAISLLIRIGLFFCLVPRERNREQAMAKADLQIGSERQERAIDEYVALVNKDKKKKTIEKKE